MKNVTIIVLILSVSCLVSGGLAQTIGIYFDQEGTQPCYTDSTLSYPISLDAYIVAKDLDPEAGLDGWEAKLSWSDSLFVSIAEQYGSGLNATIYPLCMVGLPSSVGMGSGVALLARLNVFALGPGDIYLSAHDIPSIPGSELPVYTENRVRTLFNLEFGGISEPCASVGKSIEVDSNSSEIFLKSPFVKLEIHDGVWCGLLESEKSWVVLPSYESSPSELTQEEIQLLSLVPTLGNPDPVLEKNDNTIFFDDFEHYEANSNEPFKAMQYYDSYFESDTRFPEVGESTLPIWGVTNKKSFSGDNSAYCGALWKNCTTWIPESGCYCIYTDNHIYAKNTETEMSMDLGVEFDDTNFFMSKMTTQLEIPYGGGEVNDFVYYSIHYLYEDETGWQVTSTFPVGAVKYQTDWANVSFRLPDLEYEIEDEMTLISASFRIGFYSDNFSSGPNFGAYVDDVKIVEVGGDLSIQSCNTNDVDPLDDSLSIPRVVNLVVQYFGNHESGDFTVAYSVGETPDETSLIGHVPVPSILNGYSETVSLEIPYNQENSEDEKTFDEDVSKKVHIFIDANNDVMETDEFNNIVSNYELTWHIPNAPVILIHGLGGGALKKNYDVVYGEDARRSFFSTLFHKEKLMRSSSTDNEDDGGTMFTPSAYTERGFIRDTQLPIEFTTLSGIAALTLNVPVPGISKMWDAIINNLTNSGTTDGDYFLPSEDPGPDHYNQDIFLFNYDWRLDINPDRQESLNGSTNCYTKLNDLIVWIKANHPGADRLTIVSHSMGGLIAQAYMRKNPEDHGIYRWITLGTPFQGSATAMASLFGKTGISIWGVKIPVDTKALFTNFVSAWECLPTPYFDSTAPVYAEWNGHEPFNVMTGWVCGDGCDRAPFPAPPNTSMYDIKYAGANVTGGFTGWPHNPDSKDNSELYQDTYMDMDITNQISGVDTWLIAGDGESTLRGVNRYEKQYIFTDPIVDPQWVIGTSHDVAFGPGDEQVGVWSATTANIDSSNVHKCYAPGIEHIDLIRSTGIGNFVGDIIRGRSLDSYYSGILDSVSYYSASPESPWVIKWETDAAIWLDKDYEIPGEYQGIPVSLDLYDLSGTLLIGLSHVDPPVGDDYEGPLSVTTVYDSRFSYMELDGDVYIYSDCMDYMDLRLVIRPHPQIYDTEQAGPPASLKEDNREIDIVLGHLKIIEPNGQHIWKFPDETCDVDFIKFTSLGENGFCAYVDFPIQNGFVSQTSLTMQVDGDGDGAVDPNGEITFVYDDVTTALVMFDKVTGNPNPFNASTNLAWELKDGIGTELEIHDVSGKLLRVFKLNGGNQGVVFFDGRDSGGTSLASGVYLVSVRDENHLSRALSKITIVK